MADSTVRDMDATHASATGEKAATKERPMIIDRGIATHPLNRAWTLWYDSVSTYDCHQWELSLVQVMTVRTVEDFFAMLHYCKPPHVLRVSAQYHFFREGVKPMWEDPSNKAGGKLWVSLDEKALGERSGGEGSPRSRKESDGNSCNSLSGSGGKKPDLDIIWENVLIAMVGEYLDYGVEGEHIMGVVLSKRKYHNRIALWVKDASDKEALAAIEKQLVKEGGLPPTAKIIFTPHGSGKS
uniref:WGS project CAEQ00000000 data, annotated contig 303 n=1 Tax=Trypanosoma congolense (strain IL3000) TaxID=1068625 RepID=F9WEQ8_TRYCI|nr:unnamed protein product [Trypanosoma congolense IL3000]